MALRDRQILAHLEQLPSEIAKYIFDEVRAYRARLAQGARRVLKGHILTGSLIDFWLNPAMYNAVELPERFFKNTETPGSHYACTGRQGKLGTGNLGKETEIFLPFCFLSNPPGKH